MQSIFMLRCNLHLKTPPSTTTSTWCGIRIPFVLLIAIIALAALRIDLYRLLIGGSGCFRSSKLSLWCVVRRLTFRSNCFDLGDLRLAVHHSLIDDLNKKWLWDVLCSMSAISANISYDLLTSLTSRPNSSLFGVDLTLGSPGMIS